MNNITQHAAPENHIITTRLDHNVERADQLGHYLEGPNVGRGLDYPTTGGVPLSPAALPRGLRPFALHPTPHPHKVHVNPCRVLVHVGRWQQRDP